MTFVLTKFEIHIIMKENQIKLCKKSIQRLTYLFGIIGLLLVVLFPIFLKAQSPQAIPYQAIARDANGNPLPNQPISLQFSIHDATINGTIVYQETQSVNTNQFGLFICNLGSGIPIVGTLATVNWGSDLKFLQVEMDPLGGTSYTDMGTTQLMSVPYALYAQNSHSWSLNGNAGTDPNAQQLGTTDSTDLVIKTDNYEAARFFSNPTTGGGINPPVNHFSLMRSGLVNQKWPMVASFQLGSYEASIEGRTQMDIVLLNGSGVNPDNKVMSLLANGNIGIGNTSPTEKLDVNGIGKFGPYLKIGTDVAEGYFQNAQDGAYRALQTGGDQGYWFQDYNGVNTTMYVGLNGTYQRHVGIGHTTPQHMLSVGAASSDQQGLMIRGFGNDGTWKGGAAFGYNQGSVIMGELFGVPTIGGHNGNLSAWNHLAINPAGGHVGIGTSNPIAKLDVAGNVRIADGTQGAGKLLKSDANGLASWSQVTLPDLINLPNARDISCLAPVGSVGTGSGPTSIQLSGNFSFVVNPANNIIQAINITNPSAPSVVSFVLTDNYPLAMSVSNDFAYVVNFSSHTMQVINISNPASMTVVGSVGTDLNPVSISVQGNYAYVANRNGNSLQVFDISNPTIPVLVSTLALPNAPQFVKVSGNNACLTYQNSNVFQIINISNPAVPTIVGNTTSGFWLTDITISGNYAYVLNNAGTLEVIDISNPASPNNVTNVATGSNPYAIYITGIYASVVCAGSNTMQVFNISNPLAPTLIGTLTNGLSFPQSVIISENFAYICNDNNSLTVAQLFCNNELSIDPVTNEVITTSVLPENWSRSGNNIHNSNNGNVGIGTSSPTATLDVAGNVKIADGTEGAGKVLTSDANGNATWKKNQTAGSASGFGPTITSATNFIGPTITVTITSSTQTVFISASKALGSGPTGAFDLNIWPMCKMVGDPYFQYIGGGMLGLSCAPNTRQTYAINGVFSNLPPGIYEFGMGGYSSNAVNWNNNEWGYVSYILME